MKMPRYTIRFSHAIDEQIIEACAREKITPTDLIRHAVEARLAGDGLAEHVAREVRQALQAVTYNARRDLDAAAKDTLASFNKNIGPIIKDGIDAGLKSA